MYVMDRLTNKSYEILYVDPKVNDGVDGKKDLSFTIEQDEDNLIPFNALVGRNFIVIDELVHKSQRYFINSVTPKVSGDVYTKEVTATHIYVFRLRKHRIQNTIQGTKTLDEALSFALKDSGFSYTLMDDAKKVESQKLENFGAKSSLELMDDIIATYGVDIDVNNTNIFVYKKMGRVINKKFDSASNMQSFQFTVNEDDTTTRVKGFGKLKEDKDIISDQSMSYTTKTGTWSYDDSLKADYTKKKGATFTFSFTGTGFKFKTLVSKMGGKWEFKIGDQTKTISVYKKDANPTEQEFDVIRGLDSKQYSVTATFKGRDTNNPNTKTTDPIMYLLRGNILTIYRSFKSEDEKYVFPPVVYIHPKEKDYLIEGQPSWAEDVTDDSITKESDMIKLLEKKVNPYATVNYNLTYDEYLDVVLKGIEDQIIKGDTVQVFADVQAGIVFEDSIRVTAMSYNPLDLSDGAELTFNGGEKDPEDRQIEDKKRLKEQQRYITNNKNYVDSQISALKSEVAQISSKPSPDIETFVYSIQFTNGQWQVVSGEGYLSLVSKTLTLNTDDDYLVSYVSCEPSSVVKEKGISVSIDDVDGAKFNMVFYQNGQSIIPTSVPADSKVKILIVGSK
ncbi:phage tail protein [Bacillus inaquosorum]|uniref:prophage endopeptidase tail family protein n=1 Tax=Bacillus inaquosorum TaxID=483913 RepID=UPI0022807B9C|nr:prophage endopeptidase tail family protein [Bacillus inaquosorum]MCY8085111.1 phage tail protein [Bacillus inaquosorum]